jgi:hypothetical protein
MFDYNTIEGKRLVGEIERARKRQKKILLS